MTLRTIISIADFREATGQGGPINPDYKKFADAVLAGEKPIKPAEAPTTDSSDTQQAAPSAVR